MPPMFVLNSWDIRQVIPLWCQDISVGFLSGPGNHSTAMGGPSGYTNGWVAVG